MTDKKKRNRVTSREVARAAGVSQTTVCHALNPPPGVRMNAETRRRVLRVARELGYRPNFVGRALVTGKTYTIGLLQPSYDAILSGFYQKMIRGMARSMIPDNYYLLNLFAADDADYERILWQGRVDGLFVLHSDEDKSGFSGIFDHSLPVVTVNVELDADALSRTATGSVVSDHERTMSAAVDDFLRAGRKSILAVNDHSRHEANKKLLRAFEAETQRLAEDGVVGVTIAPRAENFRRQIRNIFKTGQRWDAIFSDGLNWANVVVEEAAAENLRPGRDFQLIAASTEIPAAMPGPYERRVYGQRPDRLGVEAWTMMRKFLSGESASERVVRVPYAWRDFPRKADDVQANQGSWPVQRIGLHTSQ